MRKTLGEGTCLCVQGIVKSEERREGVSMGNSFKPLINTSTFNIGLLLIYKGQQRIKFRKFLYVSLV